jgi:hypothetical protein
VARALKIEPERLTSTPRYEVLDQDGPLEGLTELRAILAEGPYVQVVEPPTLAELTNDMNAVNRAYRNDQGRVALVRLPVLIRQLYGALHSADSETERAQVFSLLSSAFVTAERLCRRLGFTSLGPVVLDRLEMVAAGAADPLYRSQAKFQRGRILMYHNENNLGLKLIERGIDQIDGDSEGANAMRGAGHLSAAIIAARGMAPDVARDHIEQARRVARRFRHESELYGTLFGPVNVGIHSVAVALESGDPGKAANDGSALRIPAEIAPPRAGHHWQDVARSWLLIGQTDKALTALNNARVVAPQQTRLHPSVQETLLGIAAAERRRTEGLTGFARWAGVSL